MTQELFDRIVLDWFENMGPCFLAAKKFSWDEMALSLVLISLFPSKIG